MLKEVGRVQVVDCHLGWDRRFGRYCVVSQTLPLMPGAIEYARMRQPRTAEVGQDIADIEIAALAFAVGIDVDAFAVCVLPMAVVGKGAVVAMLLVH